MLTRLGGLLRSMGDGTQTYFSPANTVAPAIDNTSPHPTDELTCDGGTWTGTPTPTLTYQWQHGTTNIVGETTATYGEVASAYLGETLRCVVTATNIVGVTVANSANTSVVAVPSTYATWNPNDKGANIVLTNGNLTSNQNASGSVRSTFGKTSGKWYWEVAVTAANTNRQLIGIAHVAHDNTQYLGQSADGWGYFGGDGGMYYSATWHVYSNSYAVGDVIGVALNMDDGQCTLYKNNSSPGVAIGSLTGTVYAAVGLNVVGDEVTANFGASALVYSPPAGYNTGLYTDHAYAIWDVAAKGAGITLTNRNLTAADSTTSSDSVRSTVGKSSGKWFWEITMTALTDWLVGIEDASASLTEYTGNDTHGWSYYRTGNKYTNATPVAYGATWTNGDVLGVALDMDAGTLTFYKNGASQGVAYTGLTGTIYASVGGNLSTCVANFGDSAFTYSVPAGYNSGLYA